MNKKNNDIKFVDLELEKEILQEKNYIDTILNMPNPNNPEEEDAVASIVVHYFEFLQNTIFLYENEIEELNTNISFFKLIINNGVSEDEIEVLNKLINSENLPIEANFESLLNYLNKELEDSVKELYKFKRIEAYLKTFIQYTEE